MVTLPGLWDPPPVGAGERTGPPDFVGVGVQRCGTTRWYDLLTAHPGVHHPPDRQKELHHFDGGWTRPELGEADVYAAYFPRPPGMIVGEWTPRYVTDPWTPPLLARAAPDAKVLVLLRDPIDRIASALAHERRRGSAPATWIVADAIGRGCYDRHLERLWRHVDPSRVLVQLFESCVDDPARELARTQAFLGLDEVLPASDVLDRSVNAVAGKETLDPGLRTELREEYAPTVDRLAAMVPDLELDRWTTTSG